MPPDAANFLPAIALRTLIVLLSLVLGLRVLGKRQMGQFNIYDLALIMLLANAVQNAMTQGDGHVLTGIVSAGTLFVMGWIVSRAFVQLPKLQQRVAGNPTLLVQNGQFIKDHLAHERITPDQVMAAMRQHGIGALSEVRMAVLEVDGTISIVPCNAAHNRTKKGKERQDPP